MRASASTGASGERSPCRMPHGVDTSAGKLRVERLLATAFFPGRISRSAEYKAGCRAALETCLLGAKMSVPYSAGTAMLDAFFAGVVEGKEICRRLNSLKNEEI